MLLSLDPHQPADLQDVRHQSLTDFLRGALLAAAAGDEQVAAADSDPVAF